MPWIAAGAIIGGSLISAGAAGDAADAGAEATDRANARAEQQYQQTRGDLEPWRTTGGNALYNLANMLGINEARDSNSGYLMRRFDGAGLRDEPGYQFGLAEGQKAMDRKALAGGGYYSGAALKEAARYGTDYGATKFGEAFNRDAAQKRMAYDFLSSTSTVGQNAAAQTGAAGSQMAAQVGANTTAQGSAAGAAGIAGANALSGGIGGAVGSYQQQQLIDEYRQRNALQRAVTGGNTSFASGGGGGSAYSGFE